MTPRRAGGAHSAIAFTLPGQPLDWASPFTRNAPKNTTKPPPQPKTAQAAADASIPTAMRRRAPTRSPIVPLTYWPTAYAAR